MAYRLCQLVVISVLLAAAAGCGQKGPLYLPGDEQPSGEQTEDDQ